MAIDQTYGIVAVIGNRNVVIVNVQWPLFTHKAALVFAFNRHLNSFGYLHVRFQYSIKSVRLPNITNKIEKTRNPAFNNTYFITVTNRLCL